MIKKINSIYLKFINTKIGKYFLKYNLLYLILPIIFYGFTAILYYLSAYINSNGHIINLTIDKKIPFIKYFFIFYFSYYILPEILLWLISFKDKKKYWKLFISILICSIVSNIIYMCYQVEMVRESGYPTGIKFTNISNISEFFDYCIDFIYGVDPSGLNCFPSLHSVIGMMMILTGIHIPCIDKDKLSIPIRILGILFGLGCILSTVFIKQHYFIDMVAGCILMIIVYLIVSIIYQKYENKRRITIKNIEQIES